MLRVYIPSPASWSIKINSVDLKMTSAMGLLSRFVDGGRELKVVQPSDVLGTVGTLVPMAAARLLTRAGAGRWQRSRDFTKTLSDRPILWVPDDIDVVITMGRVPLLRRNKPLLIDPGYMRSNSSLRMPKEHAAAIVYDKSRARNWSGVYLSTQDAVTRWNAEIGVPTPDRVFNIPLFMPSLPRSAVVETQVQKKAPQTVLFVGRMARRKNLAGVIAAMDAMPARGRRLIVVTDFLDGVVDVDRDYIEHHTSLPHAQIMALMGECGIFAMPSHEESFGMVFIEALLSGCSIIAPDSPLQRDMLGPCAHYAQPDDVASIRSALTMALDERSGSRASENGVERYRRIFAPDVVANQLYDAALAIAGR